MGGARKAPVLVALLLTALIAAALPSRAQDQAPTPDATTPGATAPDSATTPGATSTLPEANAPPERFVSAGGARVRVLDKLTATTTDLDLRTGAAQTAGRIVLQMDDCRYPADNPASDAYVHLTVTAVEGGAPLFQGWMIASAPALSAMDHPRYDVWVLGCDLPQG